MNNSTLPSLYNAPKTLIIIFVTSCFSFAMIIYGFELMTRVNDTQTLWNNLNGKASQKTSLTIQIKQSFGELGIKSSFKSYIEEQDSIQGAKVELHITNAQQAITKYQALKGLAVGEAIALVKIAAIIENLQNNYLLATNLIATNHTDQLLELSNVYNQQEVDNALQHLLQATNLQLSTTNTNYQIESTVKYISFGSIFLLMLLGYAAYIIFLYRHNDKKHHRLQHEFDQMCELFNSAPLASIAFNHDGCIIAANQEATLLFNTTIKQLTNMPVEHLFATTDREYFIKLRKNSLTDGKSAYLTNKTINIVTQGDREIPAELNVCLFNQPEHPITIISFRNMSEQKRTLKLMNENQLMLNQAQQIANIGSWNWELATDKLIWSDEAYRIYGYKPGEIEVTNDTLMARIPPEERELVGNAINESVIFNKNYSITHQIVRVDGTTAIVEEHGKVIRDDENKAVRMIGTVRDVTSLKQTEQQLQLSANIFEHTVEAIVVTDSENNILKANTAFERITGFSEQEVIEQKLETILRANYFEQAFYQSIWQQLDQTDNWQGEIWNVRKNGAVYPTHQNISAIKDQQGKIIQYICIFSDISKEKLIEEQVREMAHFDQLTLLPNRSMFIERLKQTIEIKKQSDQITAVFSISLNRRVNKENELDPKSQNQLIASTAKLITHLIRKQDSVMRSGVDEFSVIIRDISRTEDAYIIAEKILKELTMPIEVNNKKVVPGCSIGIALAPIHSNDHTCIIKYAEAAMSKAKTQNESCIVVFTEELLGHYTDGMHRGNELRRAIELNDLSINFEPRLDISNNQLIAANAKVLWQHPTHGSIESDYFKDIALESNLSTELFNWLLEHACQKATQWSTSALGNTVIEIEISQSLLATPGLSDTINRILTTYQLKPNRLQLEVAEQIILSYPDIAITELAAIRDLGVGLNFDQPGSNYSTLDDIKRIGFNSVTTLVQELSDGNIATEMADQIDLLLSTVKSLPLSESIIQQNILTKHKVITSVDDKQQAHFLTGKELTQIELLEFANALKVHNILSQRTNN